MRSRFSLIALALLMFCASCSRQGKANLANAQDFHGRWKGNLSWDSTRSASLEISEGRFKVTGFPIDAGPGGVKTVSAEGEAHFESVYGAGSNPCMLLDFENPAQVVAIFILKDKRRLLYDFDVVFDQEIVFMKQ